MSDRLTAQERAFFEQRPCQLASYHAPRPVMTEHHHTKPEFLQKRLWGASRFKADLYLCSNCHDAVHAWLYWLLGERAKPPGTGGLARAEAQRTLDWYEAELEAQGALGVAAAARARIGSSESLWDAGS